MNKNDMPEIWRENPSLWFSVLEAKFNVHDITSNVVKYNHLLTKLDYDTMCLVKDIVLNPAKRDVDVYENLKKEILIRLSVVELKKQRIGSKKPSEFYELLKNKAHISIPDENIKQIWLRGLPKYIKNVVSEAIVEDNMNLLILADAIKDHVPEPLANGAIYQSNMNMNKLLEKLTLLLTEIKVEVENMNDRNKSVHEKKLNISNINKSNPDQLCWYHVKFGEQAINCYPPCNFNEKKNTSQIDIHNSTRY